MFPRESDHSGSNMFMGLNSGGELGGGGGIRVSFDLIWTCSADFLGGEVADA